MNENIVIGIEGEVASGKTSICKGLTKLIDNSIFIDGGAIYRGIVLAISKSNIDLFNKLKLNDINELNNNDNINIENNAISKIDALEIMKMLNVEFKIENKKTEIYINGNKIDDSEIDSAENAIGVSKMASEVNNEMLFKFAHDIIEQYRKNYNIIVSARNLIGIYPEMTCFVYITADVEERIKRRYSQYNGKYNIDEIRNMIIQRDLLHEKAGFNKNFERTIKVDVTNCESKEIATNLVYNKLKENGYI